ncbi:putative NAD(P)-binding-domain-containing protein [Papiliotrema laurentii]|uniref:precorrin-2 dehydrogenase n=1 Tax=Papiliotrema laurentii TaxID=5418 RepID=A0AAD9FNT2_PAPLA|nr:putative NAD(P)-binding-domain-containing protein [Papiliotrema laurentii]
MSSTMVPTPTPRSTPPPDTAYPPVVKGSSLMIGYRLDKRPVLLIGGGNVASGRLFFLLETGAHVTLIAPSPLDPSITHRLSTNAGDITWHDREFRGRDDPVKVEDFVMVLTAIDDNDMSKLVWEMCKEQKVIVQVADVPPLCDFYFGAQLRKGPLQVMISTGGQGPKIGAMVRDMILDALPDNLEEAIEGVGKLRGDLRKRAPGVGGPLGKQRMEWMIRICDEWGLGEMAGLKDEQVRTKVLDQGWDNGKVVVTPEQVGIRRKRKDVLGSQSVIKGFAGGLVSGLAIGAIGAILYFRSR